MNYLASSEDFFRMADLLESKANINKGSFGSLINYSYENDSPRVIEARLQHTDFLLSQEEPISETVKAENVLIRNGYVPLVLTLEGGYYETLDAVNSLNEGILDMAKSVWTAFTDPGDWAGILSFLLDIIGIIPFDLAGFPINQAADFLNAILLAFGPHPNYILALISLGMAIPGIGAAMFGPLKLLWHGLTAPFKLMFEGLSKVLFGGSTQAVGTAAAQIASTPGARGFGAKLGEGLLKVAQFIKEMGLKLTEQLAKGLTWVLNKVGATKWADKVEIFAKEMTDKLNKIAANADEAGDLLVKAGAGDARVSAAATDAVLAANKAGVMNPKLLDKFKDTAKFSQEMIDDVMQSKPFQELVSKGASAKVQQKFISSALTEKLVKSVVSEKSSTSLIKALKDSTIVNTLATKYGKRGLDDILTNSIRGRNAAEISSNLDEILKIPDVLKVLDEKTVKALSIFRSHPELLTNGITKFEKSLDFVDSLPEALRVGKAAADSSAKALFTRHNRTTGRKLLLFILKMFIKYDDCYRQLTSGGYEDLRNNVGKAKQLIPESVFAMRRLIESGESEEAMLTSDELEKLKALNPEAFGIVKAQEKSTEAAIEQLAPKDACGLDNDSAIALASTLLPEDKFATDINQNRGGGDVYTGITVGGEENEVSRKLKELSKSYLKAVGEDPNIDPQHPLASYSPYTKAYFSDAYNFERDGYYPNTGTESRLDQTLDLLVKSGELKESEVDNVRSETIAHWQNETAPNEIEDELKKKFQADSAELYEKISNLKVGRVKTTLPVIK